MDVPPGVGLVHHASVEGLTDDVEHVAEHGVSDRDGDAPSRVDDGRAAGEAVGRLQAYAANPPFSDLLSDFGGDHDFALVNYEAHLDRRVDLRQSVRREFDVD